MIRLRNKIHSELKVTKLILHFQANESEYLASSFDVNGLETHEWYI